MVIDELSKTTADVSEFTDEHREVTSMAFEATFDDHNSHPEHTKRSQRAVEVADGQIYAGDTSRLTAAALVNDITATSQRSRR